MAIRGFVDTYYSPLGRIRRLPPLRGHYNGHKHHTGDADASVRRNLGILDMLQQSANHGYDACRALKGMFFFWGQPSRHLFHFKINKF
jgi:hypothetical protein